MLMRVRAKECRTKQQNRHGLVGEKYRNEHNEIKNKRQTTMGQKQEQKIEENRNH